MFKWKTKVIKCENCMCIFWAGDKCSLEKIEMNSAGMCRNCIYCDTNFGNPAISESTEVGKEFK